MAYDPLRSSYKLHHENPYHMEHIMEFSQMCDQKIQEVVPRIVEDYLQQILPILVRDMVDEQVTIIWNDTVTRLVGAITRDITATVELGLTTGLQILNESKTVKRITDEICQQILQEIKNIKPPKMK